MRIPCAVALALFLAAGSSAASLPELPGWKPGKLETFEADQLFKAINGAAELYLTYGFMQLQSRPFEQGELKVSINLFDMGTSLNAFGIYRRERPKQASAIPAGAEAVAVPPYQCLLLKNRYYLKVEANRGKLTDDICSNLLTRLAKALPGSAAPPAELRHLPEKGMVPGSAAYTLKSHLALGELENCLHADYLGKDNQRYQLFTIIIPPGGSVQAVWKELAKKWKSVKTETRPVLTRNIPYRGLVAITLDHKGIYGVVDAGDARTTLALLNTLQLAQTSP